MENQMLGKVCAAHISLLLLRFASVALKSFKLVLSLLKNNYSYVDGPIRQYVNIILFVLLSLVKNLKLLGLCRSKNSRRNCVTEKTFKKYTMIRGNFRQKMEKFHICTIN